MARERAVVALPAADALRLWIDVGRWSTFVDGFGHVDFQHDRWPEPGARVVWKSRPGGRGTVTEKVVEIAPPGRFVVDLIDDQLTGRQTATFEDDEGGAAILVELDYELTEGGPLRAVADALYIRRALRDSIRRTLERFAIEAAEDAALPNGPG